MAHTILKRLIAVVLSLGLAATALVAGANPAAARKGEITSLNDMSIDPAGFRLDREHVIRYANSKDVYQQRRWTKNVFPADDQHNYYRVDVSQGWRKKQYVSKQGTKTTFTHKGKKGYIYTHRNDWDASTQTHLVSVSAIYLDGQTGISYMHGTGTDREIGSLATASKLRAAAKAGAIAANSWKPKKAKLTVKTPKAKAKKVSGTATSKARVTVTVKGKKYTVTAKSNGKWSRKVPKLKKKQKVSVRVAKSGFLAVKKTVRAK